MTVFSSGMWLLLPVVLLIRCMLCRPFSTGLIRPVPIRVMIRPRSELCEVRLRLW